MLNVYPVKCEAILYSKIISQGRQITNINFENSKQVLVIVILNFADPKDSYRKASLRENFICFLIFVIWDFLSKKQKIQK